MKKEIDSNIYIHAYSELSSYLRYLFIYYDSLVSEKDLKNIIDEIELIHYIKNRVLRQKKVYIITYNYDVFWNDYSSLRIFLLVFMDLMIVKQM